MELLNQPTTTLRTLPQVDLPLSVAFSDYDRTRPLVDGSVKMRGLAPTYTLDDIGQFCLRPVYEEFDVAEMSFSWYVMARGRGEPVRALPIFPLRMPVLSYIFCRADAPFQSPADLKGKRVESEAYRLTVNLWLRGICSDFYGLQPQDVEWFSSFKTEGAGFIVPDGVHVTLDAGDPEELLLSGKVDAVFSPSVLPGFNAGNPAIRRIFADHEAEYANYYHKTKIVPITHVMVVGEALLAREPWIVGSLLDGFRTAQARVDEAYLEPKFLSFPSALGALEQQRRLLGPTLYTHGLEGNRHIVETFVRYAKEQGYIARLPDIDELFAAV